MDYREYAERTYAAWLGKLIGIRLGAPVEGWTAEEIRRTYGKVTGYLVDYGTFAADDDSNGPLFFVRALERHCSRDITAEKMGKNVLNWLCDGHGFFWWGGEGIATEHTAYNNLKRGIPAPQSGSTQVNGIELAEQIGGQIFSDCWGYVAPGDPELARELARKMSSVTHDGDGIQGGIFVACAIALAYTHSDIRTVIEKALTYLEPGCGYVGLCRAVMEQVDAHPVDPEAVLTWIQENHGYDRYPGVCHILPNTAIMIWAMLYGDGDFDRTMTMLCEAGWDTDCTLGNVGSILGALVGLEGIHERWTAPIQDILLSSSCMGSENIDTVSSTARLFAELGWQSKGLDIPSEWRRDKHRTDFLLPRSTGGFRVDASRYFEANLRNEAGKLKVIVNNTYPDSKGHIFLKTYYTPDEVYDARYEPSFSPTVYPGEALALTLSNPDGLEGAFLLYARLRSGAVCTSQPQAVTREPAILTLSIPAGSDTVMEVGMEFQSACRQMRKYFFIHSFSVTPSFSFGLDFTRLPMEDWGVDFGDHRRLEVAQCVTHHGTAYTDREGLHLNGMVTFGDAQGQIEGMEAIFTLEGGALDIAFDVEGAMHYKAVRIEPQRLRYLEITDGLPKTDHILAEFAAENKIAEEKKIILQINRPHDKIKVIFDKKEYHVNSDPLRQRTGAAAFIHEENSPCLIQGCKLDASGLQ